MHRLRTRQGLLLQPEAAELPAVPQWDGALQQALSRLAVGTYDAFAASGGTPADLLRGLDQLATSRDVPPRAAPAIGTSAEVHEAAAESARRKRARPQRPRARPLASLLAEL